MEIEKRPIEDLTFQKIKRVLKFGDTGEDVKELQKNLRALGYPIQITGIFDNTTLSYINDIQKIFRLPQTGKYDAKTHEIFQKINRSAELQQMTPARLLAMIRNIPTNGRPIKQPPTEVKQPPLKVEHPPLKLVKGEEPIKIPILPLIILGVALLAMGLATTPGEK